MIVYCRGIFFGGLLLLVFAAGGWAETECVSCHEQADPQRLRGRYVHQPMVKKQCDQCHIAGTRVAKRQKISPLAKEKQRQEKIRWVRTLSGRQQEHWLRLPAKSVAGNLYLRAADGRLRTPVKKIVLPVLASLPQKENDKLPPQQLDITVSDVRLSISASATVRWKTDEFTESHLYYGVGRLSSVKHVELLAREHEQLLTGLDAGETYQYQIVSQDLFGNETRSPLLEFSTEKSLMSSAARNDFRSGFMAEIEMSWQLFRVGGDYLLAVTADRPVTLAFGVEKHTAEQLQVEQQEVKSGAFVHPILKSSLDTNVTVCKDCHTGLREDYSHPIKIRARRGMVIPADFPLLPDGKLSCMTCHANHASDFEYRLRRAEKSDLCRGCHTEY